MARREKRTRTTCECGTKTLDMANHLTTQKHVAWAEFKRHEELRAEGLDSAGRFWGVLRNARVPFVKRASIAGGVVGKGVVFSDANWYPGWAVMIASAVDVWPDAQERTAILERALVDEAARAEAVCRVRLTNAARAA